MTEAPLGLMQSTLLAEYIHELCLVHESIASGTLDKNVQELYKNIELKIFDIVRFLVDAGADLHNKGLLSDRILLNYALEANFTELVDYLVAAGSSMSQAQAILKVEALRQAIYDENFEKVEALIAQGVDVKNQQIVMDAVGAYSGNKEFTKMTLQALVAAGMDLNIHLTEWGSLPLMQLWILSERWDIDENLSLNDQEEVAYFFELLQYLVTLGLDINVQ